VRIRLIGAAAAVALVAGAVLIVVPAGRPRCIELAGAETLSVPLKSLAIGVPRFFCMDDARGAKLRFVLARGSDGRIRSAYDACRQCYKYHEGFTPSGGDLICRFCGNHYPVDHMTKGKASCAPVPLDAQVSGATVKVKRADLVEGRSLF